MLVKEFNKMMIRYPLTCPSTDLPKISTPKSHNKTRSEFSKKKSLKIAREKKNGREIKMNSDFSTKLD
jgi:hypothetical protein